MAHAAMSCAAFLGADAAGRALAQPLSSKNRSIRSSAAALVVLVGEDDDGIDPTKAAVCFERAEVERQVAEVPAGCLRRAARQVALKA